MKRALQSFVLALALVFSFVVPAYAAGMSKQEQSAFNEFSRVVNDYSYAEALDYLAEQYLTEAESALNKVELSETACEELRQAVLDVEQLFKDNNCKTRTDLREVLPQALKIVNDAANKYGMYVTVDSSKPFVRGGYTAHVEVRLADGTKTTVATTARLVKQTGFGIVQTAVVLLVTGGGLVCALVMARKRSLSE